MFPKLLRKMTNLLFTRSLIIASVAILPTLGNDGVTLVAKGLIVPVYTPTHRDSGIHVGVIKRYAQYLKDNKVDGIQVAGILGEGSDLSVRDKRRLVRAWVRAARPLDLHIIVQVCGIPLPDAVEMARYSQMLAVDAVMCLPNLLYKPKTAKELVYYMEFIGKAASNTSVLYSDLPEYTGVNVDMEEFFQLATKKIPNFRGLQTGVLTTALALNQYLEKGQRIFIGDNPYLAPAALSGFENFITPDANFSPDVVLSILRNAKTGNTKECIKEFQRLNDIAQAIIDQGNKPVDLLSNEIATGKTAMKYITGLDMGDPIRPIIPLSKEQKKNLENVVRKYNISSKSDD